MEQQLTFKNQSSTLYGFRVDRTASIKAAMEKHGEGINWKFYQKGLFEFMMAATQEDGILVVMPYCIDGVRVLCQCSLFYFG